MSALAEFDGLMAALSGEAPCGENLEDTPALLALEGMNVFGRVPVAESSEKRLGDPEPPPPPDWVETRRLAVELLARSKDFRGLTHLAAASLRVDGLRAMLDTIAVAAHWLETWWAGAYPPPEDGAIFRRNVLNGFADQVAILDGIRRAPLVSTREHGRISLRDLDLAAGVGRPGEDEAVKEAGHLQAAFAAGDPGALQALIASVKQASADLLRIESAMRGSAGVEASPTLDSLLQILKRLGTGLGAYAGGDAAVEGAADGGGVATTPGVGTGPVGAVRSRQDAIRALDAVAAFFRQTEPSSPVPYFVERAKRLVSKDFLEVLNDVVPGATSQAREAIGVREP